MQEPRDLVMLPLHAAEAAVCHGRSAQRSFPRAMAATSVLPSTTAAGWGAAKVASALH